MNCNIAQWVPNKWEQFVGNAELRNLFMKLLKELRPKVDDWKHINCGMPRLIVTGASRTGKTSVIRFFIRCMLCEEFDMQTWNPCDLKCNYCKKKLWLYEDYGINRCDKTPLAIFELDGSTCDTPTKVDEKLSEIRTYEYDNDLIIIFADEVHRLAKRKLEERLLTEVQKREWLWICATAEPELLEPMFRNRFNIITTEIPTRTEFLEWLVDRCREWNNAYEPEAIASLATHSNCIPGIALNVLQMAQIDSEGLTENLVRRLFTSNLSVESNESCDLQV